MNEIDLIEQSIEGNQEAFEQLLDRHMRGVYLFAYRYVRNVDDAEDVVQETFIRTWKHLKRFDTSKNFKTWIFVIAKNVALDLIKKKKPALFSQLTEEDDALDAYLAPYVEGSEFPDAIFERKLSEANLKNVMAKLPTAYRTVLHMRYDDQLKFWEIAEVLGESIDTVKSRHRRGLIMLRDLFSA